MKALPKILLALTAVAALSVAYPAKANLITNPGFETGSFFPGWSASNGDVVGTSNGVSPHSGNFQATFRPNSLLASQTFVLTPGQSYTIHFFAAAANVGGVTFFSVHFGGSDVFAHLFAAGNTPYTEFTFNHTSPVGGSTNLQFSFSGFGILFLDDISVEPAGVGVPDGGTTVSLLGCALLGLAALRRNLRC
jgi:hypothetical protein